MSAGAGTALDVLAALRAGWKRAALVGALCVAVGLAYALLSPKWYQAQISLVPSPPPKGGVPLLGGGGGAAGVAASLDLPVDVGLGPSDVERISAILTSWSVSDAVIEKFGLKERYKERHLEDARQDLWYHCGTKVERKPGVVTLTCEDRDPVVAKGMAEFFGEYGNQVFRRVSKSSASEECRFLEGRVAEARRDMDEASRALREFQETHKVIDLPEQSKAVVSVMAGLRAEMLSKEVQLAFLDGFSAHDESGAAQLKRQIGVLQAKLTSLEQNRVGATPEAAEPAGKRPGRRARVERENPDGLFPPALSMPKLRHDLEKLFRDQKIHEVLFILLVQRYEQARVNEARDTSTFQILDHPTLATKHSRPRRLTVMLIALIVGLVLGAASVLGPAWWRSVASAAPRPPEQPGPG